MLPLTRNSWRPLLVVVPEAAGVAIDVVRRAVVVDRLEVVVLVGGDGREIEPRDVPVELQRGAIAAGDQRTRVVVVDLVVAAAVEIAAFVAVAAELLEPAPRETRGRIGAQRIRRAVRIERGRRRVEGARVRGLAAARRRIDRQSRAERLGGREQQLHAAVDAILVGPGEIAVVFVLDVALALVGVDGAAPRELAIDDRAATGGARDDGVQVAVGHRPARVRREARTAGIHADDAEARVLAEQRALRTARHFDGVDVDEIEARGQRVVAVAHAVDDEAHGRILRLGLTLPAHAADRQTTGALIAEVPGHVRGTLRDGADIRGLQAIEFLAGHHRDRQRHFLQRLEAIARTHRDLAERGVLRHRPQRPRRRSASGAAACAAASSCFCASSS